MLKKLSLIGFTIREKRINSTLESIILLPYNAAIAAKSVIGFGSPQLDKHEALIHGAIFMSIFYDGMRRRTFGFAVFLSSGTSNPVCAVALLFGSNGGSYPNLDKETAMSDSTPNMIDNINQSNLIHAIIEALNIASDHPDRNLDPRHQATLLKYASDYFVALEQKNNTRNLTAPTDCNEQSQEGAK